jgi:hypothetical protein
MAKTKQKAADEAYHRAEAQRALVFVLGLAESYPKFIAVDEHEERELREHIATVRAHFLKVSEPPKEPAMKTLAGQIDLVDGSVEGAPAAFEEHGAHVPGVPDICPDCGVDMHSVYGGSWTPVANGTGFALQCGHCGFVAVVSQRAWQAVRDERRATIGAADRAPAKVDRGGRKTRGAG